MRNSKWPPFVICNHILLYNCPWARIDHRAPPLLSMSGIILIRGLLRMMFARLPEKTLGRDMDFGHENLIWAISPLLIDIES